MNHLSTFTFLALLFLPFLGLLAYMMWKRYLDAWRGQIIKKYIETVTDYDNNQYTTYYLVIQTDQGRLITFDVRKKKYFSLKVGDYLEKKARVYNPQPSKLGKVPNI